VPTDFQNSFIIRLSSKLPLLQYTHDLLPGPSNGTVAADAHQDDDDDKKYQLAAAAATQYSVAI